MGASLGMVSGAIGIAGGLSSLFGGNTASNVTLPPTWQMPGMTDASNNASSGIANLGQNNTYNIPQAQGVTNSLMTNPGAGGAIAGAGTAAGMGQAGAINQFNQGTSLYPYAQQLLQTGFDPQQALYGRTQQQLMDQTRAGQSARGIASTPYGAGLEDQQNRNFNIDWQNQQLQRQNTAGQGAASMIGQGSQIAGGAAPLFMQSAMYPYATQQQIGQNQFGALSQMGQFGQGASAIPQQQIQDYLNYIGQGNTAGGVANQTAGLALNQNALNFNQNRTIGQDLGRSVQQFGNAWSKYPGQTGWSRSSG